MCFPDCSDRRAPVQPASGVSHNQSSSKRRRRRRRRGGSQNCSCCYRWRQTIWCHMHSSCAPNTHDRQDVKHVETLGNKRSTHSVALGQLPSLFFCSRTIIYTNTEQNSYLLLLLTSNRPSPSPSLFIPLPPPSPSPRLPHLLIVIPRISLPPLSQRQTRTCPL